MCDSMDLLVTSLGYVGKYFLFFKFEKYKYQHFLKKREYFLNYMYIRL